MNMDLYAVRLELQVASQWLEMGVTERAKLHIKLAQDDLEEIIAKEEKKPSNPRPLKYWQHDETGRVCANVLHPGERWYEITENLYNRISYE